MTKAEYVEWRSNPTTKAFFNGILDRIYDLQVELGFSAGNDSVNDAKRSGAIQALNDVLNIDFDGESQE